MCPGKSNTHSVCASSTPSGLEKPCNCCKGVLLIGYVPGYIDQSLCASTTPSGLEKPYNCYKDVCITNIARFGARAPHSVHPTKSTLFFVEHVVFDARVTGRCPTSNSRGRRDVVGCFQDRWLSIVGVVRWDVSCLLYTSPSPRDLSTSRMPSSA